MSENKEMTELEIAGYNFEVVDNTARTGVNELALKVEENTTNISELKETLDYYTIGNLFNKNDIISGKYITKTGFLDDLPSYFTSGLINVSYLNDKILRTDYIHIVIFYTDEETVIPNSLVSLDNEYPCLSSVIVPNGAKFMRISSALVNIDTVQIGLDIRRSEYKPFGFYELSKVPPKEKDYIIVAKDGSGDYTSFSRAIYETTCDVIVKQGVYDIKREYIELFGAEWVANVSDETSDEKMFNFGVMITERIVKFESCAKLVCDWTGQTMNYTHRFCPICLGTNATLENAIIDVKNVFYIIHDDYGTNEPYTNIIKNCIITGTDIFNYNLIGGGCKAHSVNIVDGCYLSSNANAESTMRYHNTNAEGAEPIVVVKNTYVSRDISFRWYGAQSSHMTAIAHNNVAPLGVGKMAENDSRFDNDNVDIISWGNTVS